jgi:hypothetical protein
MNNPRVTHTNDSATDEELVLNAGRVDTGKVDVDKTLALLNEALGGQLFQDTLEMKGSRIGSDAEDEHIVIQEAYQGNERNYRGTDSGFEHCSSESTSSEGTSAENGIVEDSQHKRASEVKAFRAKTQQASSGNGKNWLSRLTGKLSKRAS